MTRDDIRKLIGGYATGSLTKAERKLLFEAALDDQELFEELAHEQSLKELIEEPGARQRLIAALDTRKPARAWWRNPWPWAAAAALCLGVVLVTVVQLRTPKPAEVAVVAQPAPPPAALAENQPVVKEPRKPIPVNKEKRREEKVEDRKVEDGQPAAAPVAKTEVSVNTLPAPAAPPPAALPAAPPPSLQATPQSPQAQQQTFESGPRQLRAAAPAGLLGGAKSISMKAARFAFDYTIEPQGYLSITVRGDGYLRVETPVPISIPVNGRVVDGSTTRLKIPEGTQELTITFAATLTKAEGVVTDGLAAKKDAGSGFVEDPNPSTNSRLVVTVQVPK